MHQGGGLAEGGRDDDHAATVAAAEGSRPATCKAQARSATVRRVRIDAWQARVGRHRAGKRVRAGIHLPFAATRSRWSCWFAGRGRCRRARSASRDIGVAIPAGGDASVRADGAQEGDAGASRAAGAASAQGQEPERFARLSPLKALERELERAAERISSKCRSIYRADDPCN